MKAKLTRDRKVVPPGMTRQKKALQVARYKRGEISRKELIESFAITAKKGTVISHPKAYMLVRLGVAEPEDEECKAAARMDDRTITAVQLASEKLEKGKATGKPEYDAP